MRRILKKNSLEILDKFKEEFRKNHGREARYSDLRKEKKYHDIKVALIEEQCGICCYCMSKIEDYNSHIEHFIPQSIDSTKDLEYSNMMISCNGYKENHLNCGHKKDDYYDTKLISPLEINCEENFKYSICGEIIADRTNIRGQKTIEVLELDSPLLNRARRSAIYISGLFDDDFEEKKEQLIDFYSNPKDGRLSPFCQAILYCINQQ